MDDRIFKNLHLTILDFENLKIHDIFFIKSANFCFLFYFKNVYKEKMFTIEIEERHEAKLSIV